MAKCVVYNFETHKRLGEAFSQDIVWVPVWDSGKYNSFSPHMLLIGRTPKLRVDNFLNPLVQTFEDDAEPSILAVQMIDKLQLIAKMHEEVKEDICQVQVR